MSLNYANLDALAVFKLGFVTGKPLAVQVERYSTKELRSLIGAVYRAEKVRLQGEFRDLHSTVRDVLLRRRLKLLIALGTV